MIDGVDLVRGAADDGLRQRIRKFTCPLLAFAGGAVCGAFLFRLMSFWALALPVVMLASLALNPPVRDQGS